MEKELSKKIVDFILNQLYEDDDNKIEFPILVIQIKDKYGVNVDDRHGMAILNELTSNELCKQTFFLGKPVLELTVHGKGIIHKYKTYSNYIQMESKRERIIIDKIQERIFEVFRKNKAKSNHIVMMRVFQFGLMHELTPPEQELFEKAVSDLITEQYIIYQKESPECLRLTEKGYNRIYDLDLEIEGTQMEEENLPTVVILTAIIEEYNAVKKHLDSPSKEKKLGTIYEKGTFSYNGVKVANIVIRETGDTNVRASLETERAIRDFEPECMFFVGIAGSIKPQDFKLGDVIFPTNIYYYEDGKAEKDKFLSRPKSIQPEYSVEEEAKHARQNQDNWRSLIQNKTEKNKEVKAGIGTIASGEKILEHIKSDLGKLIKERYNDSAAVEKEGYGFAEAIFRQGTEKKIKYGVVRGISDLVELGKKQGETANRRPDDAKEIAADSAAAFAFWLIYKLYGKSNNSVEAKPVIKAKSHLEELEEKRIRLSVKPRLEINGGFSRGLEGEIQLNLNNKGERASLKSFKVLEGNVTLHNEHLPFELEKGGGRKIFLKTKDQTNSNVATYKVVIEYEDALNFRYLSTIEGTGAQCKLIETQEL